MSSRWGDSESLANSWSHSRSCANCCYQFYLDKLNPDIDRFFQRAKVGVGCLMSRDDAHWYMKSPLSHNLLGGMMKLISESAKLSKPYTNHCLRATAVVHLKEAGVEDRTICEISGHKIQLLWQHMIVFLQLEHANCLLRLIILLVLPLCVKLLCKLLVLFRH